MVSSLGLENVENVQLRGIDCDVCGETFRHRISGDELGMANDWTVEAVTDLECPHCGARTRWTIEEELLYGCAALTADRTARR